MKQQTITENGISYKMIDRSDEVKKTLNDVLDPTLEALGLLAESKAKKYCRTDTGLLKNSITHAVAGQAPAISSYRADDPDEQGNINTGQYSGTAEKEGDEKAVYLGTNVEYAIPVEWGHMMPNGKPAPPYPFIKPAIENHVDEYKAIVKKYLSK